MGFSSGIDMQTAWPQSERHMFVLATSQNKVNVVYHFAPMGGASREQEYPAKALEIIVLTLTMAN